VTLLARSGLQSRPQFDIFVKFAPSFAKLPKLQTPNAKPLDTSFGTFWQITQMQNPWRCSKSVCNLGLFMVQVSSHYWNEDDPNKKGKKIG